MVESCWGFKASSWRVQCNKCGAQINAMHGHNDTNYRIARNFLGGTVFVG